MSEEKRSVRYVSHYRPCSYALSVKCIALSIITFPLFYLTIFQGDSAKMAGNICTNCQLLNIECTHNIPRQPKASCCELKIIRSETNGVR